MAERTSKLSCAIEFSLNSFVDDCVSDNKGRTVSGSFYRLAVGSFFGRTTHGLSKALYKFGEPLYRFHTTLKIVIEWNKWSKLFMRSVSRISP